jgi:hypothetical protein
MILMDANTKEVLESLIVGVCGVVVLIAFFRLLKD